jgi:hypothetical protein
MNFRGSVSRLETSVFIATITKYHYLCHLQLNLTMRLLTRLVQQFDRLLIVICSERRLQCAQQ